MKRNNLIEEIHYDSILKQNDVINVREIYMGKSKYMKSEKELQLYRFMVDSANDAIFYKDLESRYVIVNNKTLESFGLPREKIIGKNDFELIPYIKDARKNIESDQIVFKTGKTKKNIKHIISASGVEYLLEAIKVPQFDKSGNITGIVGIARNITMREKVDEAMIGSEEKYRSLFENLYDAAFIIDAETGTIVESNKQAEVLLGYPREEMIGMHQSAFNSPDKLNKYKEMLAHSFNLRHYKKLNTEVIKKDGITVPVSISAQMLILGGKKLIVCLFRDTTEYKHMDEEEKLSRQQLIQTDKLVSLGEVVAGVAHEINNPNSFITYNIPLLEETWEMFKPILEVYAGIHPEWNKNNIALNELIQDMNEIIYSIRIGSERINKIVANLKDYARLDKTGHKKTVNINDIIKKSMIIFGPQAKKSVKHIHINLADNLPKIKAHSHKLEQVVANLVVNSVHAISNKEEGKISIRTQYINRLRSVLIEVEDNGEGIEQDVLNRIFNPFFTTRRKEGGTGLGLSVSYRLVEEHNGIISVLSKPGVGTRFIVFLPVERYINVDIKPLILCVNNNKTVLNILKKHVLHFKNISIDTKCPSEKILQYIDEHPEVDIVISDIKTPVVNGWKILQKVKEKHPLLTVILYSGYSDAFRQKEVINVKPDYLLENPIELKRLELIVKSIPRQKYEDTYC